MNNSKSIFSVFKILLITVIRRLVDDLLAFQADSQFDEIFFLMKVFLSLSNATTVRPTRIRWNMRSTARRSGGNRRLCRVE